MSAEFSASVWQAGPENGDARHYPYKDHLTEDAIRAGFPGLECRTAEIEN
jgi:hypothetical protein